MWQFADTDLDNAFLLESGRDQNDHSINKSTDQMVMSHDMSNT